jgi:hypothetical protein
MNFENWASVSATLTALIAQGTAAVPFCSAPAPMMMNCGPLHQPASTHTHKNSVQRFAGLVRSLGWCCSQSKYILQICACSLQQQLHRVVLKLYAVSNRTSINHGISFGIFIKFGHVCTWRGVSGRRACRCGAIWQLRICCIGSALH